MYPPDKCIGYVVLQGGSFLSTLSFHIRNCEKEVLYSVNSPQKCLISSSWIPDLVFNIEAGGHLVGKIVHKVMRKPGSIWTFCDSFIANFSATLPLTHKALVMGCALFIHCLMATVRRHRTWRTMINGKVYHRQGA